MEAVENGLERTNQQKWNTNFERSEEAKRRTSEVIFFVTLTTAVMWRTEIKKNEQNNKGWWKIFGHQNRKLNMGEQKKN